MSVWQYVGHTVTWKTLPNNILFLKAFLLYSISLHCLKRLHSAVILTSCYSETWTDVRIISPHDSDVFDVDIGKFNSDTFKCFR